MPEPIRYFDKRAVSAVIDHLQSAIKLLDNLDALQRDKSISVARTDTETALLWVKELRDRAPEVL
jgi:hypothetical protein